MKTLTSAPAARAVFRQVKAEGQRLFGDVRCEECPPADVHQAVYVLVIDGVPRRVCLACTKMRGIGAVWLVGACAA